MILHGTHVHILKAAAARNSFRCLVAGSYSWYSEYLVFTMAKAEIVDCTMPHLAQPSAKMAELTTTEAG